MKRMTRRELIAAAAALGASAVLASPARASRVAWNERRDLFPEGVASGDPSTASVVLWTRRPYADGQGEHGLTVEVAEDPGFAHVVATSRTRVLAISDWTARVLVGGLAPAREYWYRFTDAQGNRSRIGRTLTAPADDDARPARFAFVSCQNANQGAQNAYRRMIYEDERAPPEERIGFVLHLGDFIYELVWYPEDRPTYLDRKTRDIVRYPKGEKISDFHIPVDVDDYRAVYRAYLGDPDLQDARARFPFVDIWDNHEFSWLGWQSFQEFGGKTIPRQTRKVAANQAWFEYHPARVKKPSPSLETFDPPAMVDAPITQFDDNGLGQEPNNLKALASLTAYRALRWGKNVELFVTDGRSYRSKDPLDLEEAAAFAFEDYPQFYPEDVQRILNAGRAYAGGAPAFIESRGKQIANYRQNQPPETILGAEQKAWFLGGLKSSQATWKVWGSTTATLPIRVDPQNLPKPFKTWPGAGYGSVVSGEQGTAFHECAEIYDLIARENITGFATIAGDRHAFWAGLSAKALPPEKFEPVGVAFVTGSISAPGAFEAAEHRMKKDDPFRPLYLADLPGKAKPEPTMNLLYHYGVRAALEYAAHGDIVRARKAANPDCAPHIKFADLGGHGYAVVRAAADKLDVEFVCIPRPIERAGTEDGGPLRYRVVHTAKLWPAGARPQLEQSLIEGDADLSM
ncbi:MAG: alkaline phosphatase D family protein [Alphaproteobacteria bacterium]